MEPDLGASGKRGDWRGISCCAKTQGGILWIWSFREWDWKRHPRYEAWEGATGRRGAMTRSGQA